MTHILCIETATDICSVCLATNGKMVAIRETARSFSHTEVITVFIRECLAEAKLTMGDLSAVAVTSGPGSYTALRIGSSTAKGICFALDIPLIAVDTIKSLAQGVREHAEKGDLIIPLLDARRMEVYCAVYDHELVEKQIVSPIILDENTFSDLERSGTIHLCGDGVDKSKSLLSLDRAVFHASEASAKNMIPEAFRRFSSNEFEHLVNYTPYYFKGPNITVQKKNIL